MNISMCPSNSLEVMKMIDVGLLLLDYCPLWQDDKLFFRWMGEKFEKITFQKQSHAQMWS